MDWAKAKTVLIYIFILLNIFLFSIVLYTNSSIKLNVNYVKYANDYLKAKEIQVISKIPVTPDKAGELIYKSKTFNFAKISKKVFGRVITEVEEDGNIYIADGEEKIELIGNELLIKDKITDGAELFNNMNKLNDRVLNYFEGLGYLKSQLILQVKEESEKEKIIVYNIKYKNALLFDYEVKVSIDSQGMLILTFPPIEPKQLMDGKEIISAYQTLIMSGLPRGSIIQSVDFGYKCLQPVNQFDNPVWRVILRNGESFYYNAYTGELLQ